MIIVRYREIFLKGNLRVPFERVLQKNIKDCLKKNNIPFTDVKRFPGRIIIFSNEQCPQLQYVAGISSFSYAREFSQDIEEIKQQAQKMYTQGTFRISCQRMQDYPLSSVEVEKEVGAYIVEKTKAKVRLKDPEVNIHIELCNNHSYLFTESISGLGGLPVTKESHVVLLLQDANSVQAGIQMIKRGCTINIYKEKEIPWLELKKYEYGFTIKEIKNCPENAVFIVSDTFQTIKDYSFFVLRPLL